VRRLTVETVERKVTTKGKPYVFITTTSGEKFSVFNGEFTLLQPGVEIECEMETKGQYTNIKAWHPTADGGLTRPVQTLAPPTRQPAPQASPVILHGSAAFPDDRTEQIMKQVAIKEIGECYRMGEFVPDVFMFHYWNWIGKQFGLLPAVYPVSKEEPSLFDEVRKMGGVEMITDAQCAAINKMVKSKKLDSMQIQSINLSAGLPETISFTALTKEQATKVIEKLNEFKVT
jgi:hypothetical protein